MSSGAFLANPAVDGYDVVVNAALDPRFHTQPYDAEMDMDLRVARAAKAAGSHFVMLSTRKVYDPVADTPVAEDHPLNPDTPYGRNKLTAERAVRDCLPGRATILRVANVCGYEPDRPSFFGQAMTSLRDRGVITLDTSPFVRRDFIAVGEFSEILTDVVVNRPAGTYSVGSGKATQIGHISLWLIEGFGAGELVVTSPREQGGFELDRAKLVRELGWHRPPGDLRQTCVDLAVRLRHD